MIGLLVDLHGTLLESNLAWARALESIDPKKSGFYREQIQFKRSRHELAQIAGVSFDSLLNVYRKYLLPRDPIVALFRTLSCEYPSVLVSNCQRDRVLADLHYLPTLSFKKIYTIEEGKKPERIYLQRILDDQGWDKAFLLGNDLIEDYSENENVTSIICPQRRLKA